VLKGGRRYVFAASGWVVAVVGFALYVSAVSREVPPGGGSPSALGEQQPFWLALPVQSSSETPSLPTGLVQEPPQDPLAHDALACAAALFGPTPDGEAPASPPVASDCDLWVTKALTPALGGLGGPWTVFYAEPERDPWSRFLAAQGKDTWSPVFPVARRDVRGAITVGSRRACVLSGTMARGTGVVAVLMKTDGDIRVADLETLGVMAVLRRDWPDRRDLGSLTRKTVAGGRLLVRQPVPKSHLKPNDGVTNPIIGPPGWWLSWSDGRLWLAVAGPDLPDYSWSGLPHFERDFVAAPWGPRDLEDHYYAGMTANRSVFRLSAPTIVPGDLDDMVGYLGGLDANVGQALSMEFETSDEWARADRLDVPATVRSHIGAMPPGACLTLRSDARTSGLLTYTREWGTDAVRSGVLRWSLDAESLAVTLVCREEAARASRGQPSPGQWRVRSGYLDCLPALLGEYGKCIVSVPSAFGEISDSSGFVAPVQDTQIGFLEPTTVGDTPWGRCWIYSDPVMMHIVFDLG